MTLKYLLLFAFIAQYNLIYADSSDADSSEKVTKIDSINCCSIPTTMFGALFDSSMYLRKAFSLAIRTMNMCIYNATFCDKMHACEGMNCRLFHQMLFTANMMETSEDLLGTFKNIKKLDNINYNYGIAAIVGPNFNDMTAKYVQGFCELHDLPNIIIKRELYHDRIRSINLYPDLETLATVYVKMVEKLNWTSFSILYEETDQMLALDNVLKMHGPLDSATYAFHIGTGPNYTLPLLVAKEKNHKNFILDCANERLAEILKQIQQVGMMTNDYKYIITSLDLQVHDLGPYRYSGVNISGIRMVDAGNDFVQKFVSIHLEDFGISEVSKLPIADALMFDAVALLAHSYKDLTYQYRISKASRLFSDLYKGPKEIWKDGLSFRNYILYNTINGLSGPVLLDSDGSRRRFKLDILNLRKNGLESVGTWSPDDGFDDRLEIETLKTKHFKVLISMNKPYAMKVNHSKSVEGNDRYEGFVVDIISELSKMMGFNYTFYVHHNTKIGSCNKSSSGECSCSEMMEKILSGEMDMAIADLTITKDREDCVDFSTAFWNLGMSILYKKPVKAPPTPLSFLNVLQMNVWLYLIAVYIFVSLLLYALARACPAEWTNPFPCIEEPSELVNQFSISNAFAFTIGGYLQQGSDYAPVGVSTRTLAGFWWCFCLIITQSYTANLAAFLTIESPVKVVKGIEDLYNQTKIKFGANTGGSTFMYFQSSKDPRHRQLAEVMKTKEWQKYMVSTNDEGIELVKDKNEDYAFFMESSSIEYTEMRECTVEQAGPFIDHKSYAIAYKEGFEYHRLISKSISILQERLTIKDLYKKWWKEKGAKCFEKASASATEPMNLEQMYGIFLTLGVGVLLALFMTIWEFCSGAYSVAKKENVKFTEIVKTDIKHAMSYKSTKSVFKRNQSMHSKGSIIGSSNYTITSQI